jgi:hypothetical protein
MTTSGEAVWPPVKTSEDHAGKSISCGPIHYPTSKTGTTLEYERLHHGVKKARALEHYSGIW